MWQWLQFKVSQSDRSQVFVLIKCIRPFKYHMHHLRIHRNLQWDYWMNVCVWDSDIVSLQLNNAGMLPRPPWTSYLPQTAQTCILPWEATAATATTSFHGHCRPIHLVKDSLGPCREKKPPEALQSWLLDKTRQILNEESPRLRVRNTELMFGRRPKVGSAKRWSFQRRVAEKLI